MTNKEILATFSGIFERWKRELREWDTSRQSNEVLTFGTVMPEHGSHDVTSEGHPLPPEHGVPRSG